MEPRRLHYLRAMGITPWVARSPSRGDPGVLADATDTWPGLCEEVAACRACPLHQGRTQTVFGVGDTRADWMIVGEAPGAEEDRRGEPFVGRAGQLLDAMLAALGLDRQRGVYIANVVKCRPPSNRNPHADEAAACAGFLDRQIELLRPGIILAVGRVAAARLLGEEAPLGRQRGRVYRYGPREIPVVVTYHPAYLLRQPSEKAKAWQDLLLARRVLAGRPA